MHKILNLISSIFFYLISLFVKRDGLKIAIGSWCGKLYADNSKYLGLYIKANYPQFTVYWVGDKKIKESVEKDGFLFLKMNTFSTNLKLLKCKYFFFSQMASADISESNVFRNSVTCYLHHGMPIKKWGDDAIPCSNRKNSLIKRIYCSITGSSMHYSFFATSSLLHDNTNLTALKCRGCTEDKNLKSGTPRNDFLINVSKKDSYNIRKRYLNLFKIQDEKVILYLPTYRRKSTSIFSFANLSEEESRRLDSVLEKFKIRIIEKSHFAEKNLQRKKYSSKNIIIIDLDINVQELYLASDCLITDYSGAFLDYLFLRKPIIHYVYDYEYYKTVDSGLYYDIDDFSAGPVVERFDDLIRAVEDFANGVDLFENKREYVKSKYMSYEEGKASKHIFDKVVLTNELEK